MQLCQGRPEGLSSTSNISYPLPTQCYFDTILVPLPTWIFLILLAVLPLVFRAPLGGHRVVPCRRWVRITVLVVYYFFIGVIILMETVEVARLVQVSLGIGLIPFVYAGCVIAAALQATKGLRGLLRGWQAANLLFWAVGMCVTAAKLAAIRKFGFTGPLARNDTAYPIEHQLNDLVILVAFYALLMGVELCLLFLRPGHQAASRHPEGPAEK